MALGSQLTLAQLMFPWQNLNSMSTNGKFRIHKYLTIKEKLKPQVMQMVCYVHMDFW